MKLRLNSNKRLEEKEIDHFANGVPAELTQYEPTQIDAIKTLYYASKLMFSIPAS